MVGLIGLAHLPHGADAPAPLLAAFERSGFSLFTYYP